MSVGLSLAPPAQDCENPGMMRICIVSISLLFGCASAPTAKHARGPELPAAIVFELAEGKSSYALGYADLDALRNLIELEPAHEKRLLEISADPVFKSFSGVASLAYYFDNRDAEFALFSCKTASDTERLASGMEATWIDRSIKTQELEQHGGSSFVAYRMSDLCVLILKRRLAARIWPELLSIQDRIARLPARETKLAHVEGKGSQFPWSLYNMLVKGPAKEPPSLMEAVGIAAWARVCKHVNDGFDKGSQHCKNIPEFEVNIDAVKKQMTWTLEYSDPALREIMWKVISSIPKDAASAIGLDVSDSYDNTIKLRHDVPMPKLGPAALAAIATHVLGG